MAATSSLMKYWILLLLSVGLFFMGLHVGKEHSLIPSGCPSAPTGRDVIVTTQADGSISVRLGTPSVGTIAVPHVDCPAIAQEVHTGCDRPTALSVLVKGKATVPEDIFSFLHHPASPAKEMFFLTDQPSWKAPNVLSSPCREVYLTRTGSRANQPNKCVALVKVPAAHVSINQQSHRSGFTARNTDQYQADYPRHTAEADKTEEMLLRPFLQELQELVLLFHRKMGPAHDHNSNHTKTAIVMVANEGVMDLLLNFICSAEAIGIDLSTVVVFVGDEAHIALIENMGAVAIYSPALGSMPSRAAGAYLDNTFSRMMWCKATSVYLSLVSGFNVLFQDVDLVWLKNPLPYLQSLQHDVVFMDDGARTPRYTPFFVNSGFYYIAANARSVYMFETMTKNAANEISQTHSHQSVLIKHLSEAHHLFGLSVYVLDQTAFPSGQAYHENKPLVRRIQSHAYRPYLFHMCWTDNRDNKLVYFKDIGLWYLPEGEDVCSSGPAMLDFAVNKGKVRDRCCLRDRYWPPPPAEEVEDVRGQR